MLASVRVATGGSEVLVGWLCTCVFKGEYQDHMQIVLSFRLTRHVAACTVQHATDASNQNLGSVATIVLAINKSMSCPGSAETFNTVVVHVGVDFEDNVT